MIMNEKVGRDNLDNIYRDNKFEESSLEIVKVFDFVFVG